MLFSAISGDIEIDDDGLSTSCMNTTASGVILCIGYENGEIYIYNISEAEPVMEIHSRLSTVTALLLLCADTNDRDTVGDGVLLIGYDDGFVEAFNCKSGERMMARQCHQFDVRCVNRR